MEIRSLLFFVTIVLFYDVTSSFVLRNKELLGSQNIFNSRSLPAKQVYFDVVYPIFDLDVSSGDLENEGEETFTQNGAKSRDYSDVKELKNAFTNLQKTGHRRDLKSAIMSPPLVGGNDVNISDLRALEERRMRNTLSLTRASPARQYRQKPRRRGLADPGLGLAQKNPWDLATRDGTGISYAPAPGVDSTDESRDDVYTYVFVGERFKLNGSAKIYYDGIDKFRITFLYSITGDGNATAELVTPEQEVKVPTWNGNGVTSDRFMTRPDSCHLQASENKTSTPKCSQSTPAKDKTKSTTQKKSSPRSGGGRRQNNQNSPFVKDQYSFLTSSVMSQYGPSISGSFIFPKNPESVDSFNLNNNNGQDMKGCDVTMTTYVRKWLCIGRTAPPCFMVLMQGSKYRVAEKICPQRFYNRRGFVQSLT